MIVPSLPLGNGQEFRIGPGCETGPIMPDKDHPQLSMAAARGSSAGRTMTTSDEQHYWVGARIALWQRRRDPDLPLPAGFADGGFAVRRRTRCITARSICTARRDGGVTWEKISPDLTAHPPERRARAASRSRAMPPAKKSTSTLYAIRESPAAEGPDLDRVERRPGLRDARRRQDLDQRNARRTCRPADACRISSPARCRAGNGLRGDLSVSAGRFRALYLPHRRFRQDLDAADRRQERDRGG